MSTVIETPDFLEAAIRLNRDIREVVKTPEIDEAKQLVYLYYAIQRQRVRMNNQISAAERNGKPHRVMDFYFYQMRVLESNLHKTLTAFAKSTDVGLWCLSIRGVGPVITSGFTSEIDFKVPTAGHVWSYCGLAPGRDRPVKGKRLPYNARMKRLCYLVGDCFVKTKGHKDSYYGQLYEKRKTYEMEKNERGDYADQAKRMLETMRYRENTVTRKCLEQGRLSDGHIHMRAMRWTVKMFLSHMHCVGHFCETGDVPPRPYAFDWLRDEGHSHMLWPPNHESVVGLTKALESKWIV